MGDRIGIIAGSGDFPFQVAAEAHRKGWECAMAAVRGETDPRLRKEFVGFEWFEAGDLGGLVEFLKNNRITKVLIAGKFKPETLFRQEIMDVSAAQVVDRAGGKSPVRLIGSLIKYLETLGVIVMDPTPLLAPLFCLPGILTRLRPTPSVAKDIDDGLTIARTLADLDIGQTVIIKDGAVIAVEGFEGTDLAIRRGGELAGPGITAVKVSRSKQDPRIDIPAAGLETIKNLASVGGRALCIEAGKIPFFRREEAVALADKHGISILVSEMRQGRPEKRKEL